MSILDIIKTFIGAITSIIILYSLMIALVQIDILLNLEG